MARTSAPSVRANASIAVRAEGVVGRLAAQQASTMVSARELELEALLHLPRLADADGTVPAERALAEIVRVANRLAPLRASVESLWRAPARPPILPDLEARDVPEKLAAEVMANLHYLHSPRRESLHIGTFTPQGRLVALVSVSTLDVPTLIDALPEGVGPGHAMVVSRVFAFDWAPRNAISHLLGHVERRLRQTAPELRLLLTYVNPNLGFDGVSCRAANWRLFARELGTRYGYLDEDYVTDREIARLPGSERERVTYSTMPLAPLLVFARAVDRRLAQTPLAPRLLRRP